MGVRLGDMGYGLIATQSAKGTPASPTDVIFLEDNSPIDSAYDVVKQNVQIGSLASSEAAVGYGLAKVAGQVKGPVVINAGIEAVINAFGTGIHHKGTDSSGDDTLWTITAQVDDVQAGTSTVTISGNNRNNADTHSTLYNLPRPGQAVMLNPNSLGQYQPGALLAAISDLVTTHHVVAGPVPAYDEITGLELGLLPPPTSLGLTGANWVGYTMCSISAMRLLASPETPRPWSTLELNRAGGYADQAPDVLFSAIEFAADKENWKATYDIKGVKPLNRLGGAYAATVADLFSPSTAALEDLFQLMLIQGTFIIVPQDDTAIYTVVSAAASGQVVTLTFAAATFSAAQQTKYVGKQFVAAGLTASAGSVAGANGEYTIQAMTSTTLVYTAVGTVTGTFNAGVGTAAVFDEHHGLIPTAQAATFKLDQKGLELPYFGRGAYDTQVGGQDITLTYKYDNRADRPMEREEFFDNIGYVKTRRVLMGCLLPGQPGAGTASGVAGLVFYTPRATFDMPKFGAPIGALQSVDVTMKARKYGNNKIWGEWTLAGNNAGINYYAISNAGTPVAMAECWIMNAMVDTQVAGTAIGQSIAAPFS